jgi:serine/threonine protein phosphatase PrpC
MPIAAFGRTGQGCVRAGNEDRILVQCAPGIYPVYDGMDGGRPVDEAAGSRQDVVAHPRTCAVSGASWA